MHIQMINVTLFQYNFLCILCISYIEHYQIKIIIKYNHMKVLHFITVHSYVGFISKCNGIIGMDAIGHLMLFEDCAKVIVSSGTSSYLRGNGGDGTT